MPDAPEPRRCIIASQGGCVHPENYSKLRVREGTTPPPMSTPGSGASAAGLTIMLISVSIGINFGGGTSFAMPLSFTGLLAGVSLVVIGVRVAGDDPAAQMGPALFPRARALAAFLRRHLVVVGLVMASSAVTAVSGKAGPALCFAMFTLLLLGLSLINVGVIGE